MESPVAGKNKDVFLQMMEAAENAPFREQSLERNFQFVSIDKLFPIILVEIMCFWLRFLEFLQFDCGKVLVHSSSDIHWVLHVHGDIVLLLPADDDDDDVSMMIVVIFILSETC
jgi:hypothetical protein